MIAKTKKLTGIDRRYGWEFGCEGWASTSEAAQILDISVGHFCRLLRELEDTAVKSPTDRTWPLRAGKPKGPKGKTTPWKVCRKSVLEYAETRKPVEV